MINFEQRLCQYIDAVLPIIYVESLEDDKVTEVINKLAKRQRRTILEWTVRGLYTVGENSSMKMALPETLELLMTDKSMLQRKILVIKDIQYFLDNPEVIVRLKQMAQNINNGIYDNLTIIIIAPLVHIPKELEAYISITAPDFLTKEEIAKKIEKICEDNEIAVPSEALMFRLKMLLTGLSETEIESIVFMAISSGGGIDASDIPMILEQKQQMIKKSGILEMIQVKEKMDDIGGLENLKKWLYDKNAIFDDIEAAEEFGVNIPKGVLIAGMPGCGKSLTAKAAAKTFNMPLLRMDMGRLMGKYVGESEGNMRRALRLTEASSPCVLWIDEMEKAFAGIGSSSSSEVTTRLFGNFLTWMQEKDSLAFVVATANNISNLPPELLRKGRFDEIFYVGLPSREEREKIFEIHLRKRRKNDLKKIDLRKLADNTEGYCGADIEGVVRDAVELAFVRRQNSVTTDDILEAIGNTHSLSETMKDNLDKMAKVYKERKFKKASRS